LITQETDRSRHRPAVAGRLDEAARGGKTINVAVPLQVVLSLEGVECQPGRHFGASLTIPFCCGEI
jgi:hypothetical protein